MIENLHNFKDNASETCKEVEEYLWVLQTGMDGFTKQKIRASHIKNVQIAMWNGEGFFVTVISYFPGDALSLTIRHPVATNAIASVRTVQQTLRFSISLARGGF